MLDIRIEKTTNPKPIPDESDPLVFGTIFTDHMFVMDYDTEKGWYDPRVIPYQPLSLDPSAMVFHYGQEMEELYYSAQIKILKERIIQIEESVFQRFQRRIFCRRFRRLSK